MVTTKQIFTQKRKKKSKHNTKDSHQITKEENKRSKEKKHLQKQIQNK